MTDQERIQKVREAVLARISEEDCEELLDETVKDLKNGEASEINNNGFDAQIDYILKAAGPGFVIRTFLAGKDPAEPKFRNVRLSFIGDDRWVVRLTGLGTQLTAEVALGYEDLTPRQRMAAETLKVMANPDGTLEGCSISFKELEPD